MAETLGCIERSIAVGDTSNLDERAVRQRSCRLVSTLGGKAQVVFEGDDQAGPRQFWPSAGARFVVHPVPFGRHLADPPIWALADASREQAEPTLDALVVVLKDGGGNGHGEHRDLVEAGGEGLADLKEILFGLDARPDEGRGTTGARNEDGGSHKVRSAPHQILGDESAQGQTDDSTGLQMQRFDQPGDVRGEIRERVGRRWHIGPTNAARVRCHDPESGLDERSAIESCQAAPGIALPPKSTTTSPEP